MIKNDRNVLLTKAYVISAVFALLCVAILFRIIQIQATDAEEYRKLAQDTHYRLVKVPAARGNLYAANGVLLATTILKYNVFLDLVSVKESVFKENVKPLSDSLSRMFGKPSKYYEDLLWKQRNKENRYFRLKSNLDFAEYSRLKTFPIFNKGKIKGGFIVEKDTIRAKTISGFGNRTLGFDDERGKAGLEGAFSSYLRGKDGQRYEQLISGNLWKPMDYWNETMPEAGMDVYTTIDMRIQDIAYTALQKQLEEYEAQHGCAVVMEVKTGKILAMTNLTRMPNGSYLDLRNYAVFESSEPGSTFKTMSVLAALDDGYITPETYVGVGPGYWKIGDKVIIDEHSRGTITTTDVMAQSSNVGVARIVMDYYKKNPENFVDKLNGWGLNQKLGIEIPGEGQPKIPHPIQNKEHWNYTSLPWMSFGYGVSLTPLQTLTFYNGIANNGKIVKPLLIEKVEYDGKVIETFPVKVLNNKIASQEALSDIKQMLIAAVDKGTAKSIYTPNLSMAGKTGTAQVEYWKKGPKQYQASFCGFFPGNNPQYSCIVVIYKPSVAKGFYGADVAAPVFKEIAGKVFLKTPLNIPKSQKKDSKNVVSQLKIKRSNPVKSDTKYLPDLIGTYGYEVIPALENLGIKVKYKGSGKVAEQSLEQGTKLKKGMVLYLKLE